MLPVSGAELKEFRREMRAPHDFAQRRVFEVSQAGAVVAFRKEQIPKPLGPRFGFQFFNDRIDFPRAEFLSFLIEALLVRIDVPVHKRLKATF
jgi:hypothetical protein